MENLHQMSLINSLVLPVAETEFKDYLIESESGNSGTPSEVISNVKTRWIS